MRLHFLPASFETKRPPASLSESLSIRAYTFSGFERLTAMAILPISSGKPSFILSHVSPSSVDLYRPLPGPPLMTFHGSRPCSHIAAYRIRGFVMSIDSSAAPVFSSTKRTFFQVLPPSLDLKRPRSLLGA